ncbi:unnamed protein product [Clonostachys byssicola]|uniref:Uncharacterized protein n=1 Tax=Clonostachys byssicola TaxID=160290 RepID=A0A9N9U2L5_9HYPO|nr:unnamed protein product [Clonostachys byssicola]
MRNILSFPWEATELGKAASREDGGGGHSAVASREGNGDGGREGGGALRRALIVITLIVVALIVILSVVVVALIIVATVVAAVVTTIVSSVVAVSASDVITTVAIAIAVTVSAARSRGDARGAGARDSDGGVDGGLNKSGPGETALDDGGRNIGDNGDDRGGQAGLVGRTRGDGSASGSGSRRVGPGESGAAGEDRSIAGDVLVDQRRGNAGGIRDGADCGGQGNSLGDNGSGLGGLGKVVDVTLLGRTVGDSGSTAGDGVDLSDADGQGGLRGCFVESTTVPVEVTGRVGTGHGDEGANSSNGSLHLDCYFGNETELWVVVVIELKSRMILSRRRLDCEQSEFD